MPDATSDPFNLERFVTAQSSIYAQALGELKAGAKRSHWMWFIFPQVAGLGFSSMSQKYAIRSRDEAVAYLEHPMLCPRLEECAAAVLAVEGKTANQIMGDPDDLKLQSSMTLFNEVKPGEAVFLSVLRKYFHGEMDDRTLQLLGNV